MVSATYYSSLHYCFFLISIYKYSYIIWHLCLVNLDPPLGMIYTIFVGDHYTIIPTILVYLMIHIAKPINMLLGKLFLTDNIQNDLM
jgi:hypothetical protein